MSNWDADLLQEIVNEKLKVFLVDIVPKQFPQEILDDRMTELESLVDTYGGTVVMQKYQRKDTPDLKTYLWKWKLEEIIEDMKSLWLNLLIIGNILKPRQLYEISEKLRPFKIRVWDRVDLILKIFGIHADWMEARLQIELASIKHMGPRIFWMGLELSKQWAWQWARWLWETNTERMKRHLKEKQRKIQKKLEEYEKMRKLHRESRKRKNLPTVWIVGYTNAGKSSLLNSLTNKNVLAENKLFATLWTNIGKLFVWTDIQKWIWKEILLNDTIGFIRDLPPQLIKAFRSTLEDSIESDFLLHVIDASDPFVEDRILVVNEILDNIWAKQERIMVFNKIDLISKEKLSKLKIKFKEFNPLRISIKNEMWLDLIKERIVENL